MTHGGKERALGTGGGLGLKLCLHHRSYIDNTDQISPGLIGKFGNLYLKKILLPVQNDFTAGMGGVSF